MHTGCGRVRTLSLITHPVAILLIRINADPLIPVHMYEVHRQTHTLPPQANTLTHYSGFPLTFTIKRNNISMVLLLLLPQHIAVNN